MKFSWFLVFGALIFFSTPAFSQATVVSDFATNADGWTSTGSLGTAVNYTATGGNPNGYISAQTPGSVVLGAGTLWIPYFIEAPAKFEGNMTAYYGGGISFDLSQTTTGTPTQYAAVVMTTPAGASLWFYPNTLFQPPSFGAWTTFYVPLSATTGEWKTTNSPTGTAASASQIQAALGSLSQLQIQGLYRNANVVTRFDNITMRPPITISTQPTSTTVCNGATATFTALGTNNPNITYQWQLYNPASGAVTNLTNTGGYSGTTTGTLSVNTTGNFGAGYYRARISGTGVSDVYTNAATLTINPLPTAPTTTGDSNCGPFAPKLVAAGGTLFRWYTVATGGTAIAGATGNSYSPGTITTTTNYWVTIDNGTCESTRTIVTATVNTIPAAPTTTGSSRCGTGTVTLTASGGSAGQYRWYTVSTGGTAITGQTAATYTTPSLTTSTDYWVSINNGTCEGARTMVTATINTIPAAPATTGNSRCGTGTVTLTASGGSAGQYRWYTVSTGGTAIAGQTAATYTTPSLTTTTDYWVAINNGSCEGARTMVTATINTVPAAPTTTGASICGPGTVTLTASGGSAGQYRWYTVSTGGTAIAGQAAATYTTPSLTTTTDYWVSINNGTCEGARTMVTATINTVPSAPSTTGNSRCGTGTVTLTASGGSAGQYRWYTVSTGGTAIAGQTAATYTTPSLTTSTDYWVSINNGTCEGARTMVTATINTVPAAPTTTGNSRCGTGTVTLTASGGSAGQYRWYTVATGGTAIAGQTAATYTTPSLTTSTDYWVSINNGTCEGARTMVTATINTIPAAPTAPGVSACGSGTVTLTASGGSAGQYRWYTVSTGGTAISGQTAATYTTPILTTSTDYWVAINNGLCEGARTMVTATINSNPAAPATTGNSRCGSGTVTLSASGGSAGQYRWYTVSTGGTAIAGQTAATYTTPSLTTTTDYWVSINNGNCEGARTMVTATINTVPAAPTTTGNSRCGSGTLTLSASGGSAGQYRWYTVSTGGTAIAGQVNSTLNTGNLSTTSNFYVSINNGTCESARTLSVATINNLPATPGVTGASGCAPSSVILTASGGANGQYRWYTVPTGGTAIAGEVNSTYTTPILSANTDYYVSINNGTCEGSRATVTATINNPPSAPTTTDGNACAPGVATLSASGAGAGQYRWYTDPTGGTAIAGTSGSTFDTPVLTTSTTYYVSIFNGCEGPRTSVTANVIQPPSAPNVTVNGESVSCVPKSFNITATGGANGEYRWYTDATGGTPDQNVSGSFATPVVSNTTTFYAALNENTCESVRVPVTVTIGGQQCANNSAPVIASTQETTFIGGEVVFDMADLISDPDNNLDLSTLTITSQPESGATATFDDKTNKLVINYKDAPSFTGIDQITIKVCDAFGACTEQTLNIDVTGSITIYNAVSPNKDGKNDVFFIDHIDVLETTKENHVMIFNRWGDLVWEGKNYNNTTVAFAGVSKNNAELPSGTYYYKIEFGKSTKTGYLELKR